MRLFSLVLVCCLLIAAPSANAASAPLDVMIGQMLMAGFRGDAVDKDAPIVRDIRERHLGGVILFDYDVALGKADRNIKSPRQVKALTRSLQDVADIPLLVAVDQEGGRVQRLKAAYGFTETPAAADLGHADDATVLDAARIVGKTVADAGFNLDFAPVADVNVNPESPAIGKIGRSFSADPVRVARCDELFLQGLAERGVIGCLKHFPGHGSAGADSHLGVTDVSQTWQQAELTPYALLLKQGAPRMIMTAHIFNARLDPDYPATLSRKIITGILREQLGFDGVVVTDDMNMKAIADHFGLEEAIRLSVEAGADILLFGNNLVYDPDIVRKAHAILRGLVDNGTLPVSRIETSYARIMRLKNGL